MSSKFYTAIYDVSLPCNYRCIYCRNDWSDPLNNKHVGINKIKANIAKFIKSGFSRIIFTGGEFFIIPYWKEIIDYSKSLGLEIWIISNGYSIKTNDISFIKERVEKINISFHAHNSKLYEKIMRPARKKAFSSVLNNMKNLSNAGIKIGIFFSPLKENVDYFYETIKKIVAFDINVVSVNLNRIVAVQYTNEYFNKSSYLNFYDHKHLVQQAIQIYKEFNIHISLEGYPYCFLKDFIKDENIIECLIQPCLLGRKAIAFNYDGSIKLCPATHFSISGKDQDNTIENNQIIKTFLKNNWRNKKCKECLYWEKCLGGCHAAAGELFADDPLILYDDIYFKYGIDNIFFDLLINLYRPFLSADYKKAFIKYTVFSKANKHPIGIIALKKSKVSGIFIEIALIPSARSKNYSFQIFNLFFKKHNLNKIGWTVNKANLPSVKLLQKLRGGFFEKTIKNKKRLEAEGFFRRDKAVSKSMRKALDDLLPESESKYLEWLEEYGKRIKELKNLEKYLRGYGNENN